MNFLAHFHLAWPDEDLIAGGLEGDYYKGPLGNDLPAPLARGVRLHRAIDAYTDAHPRIATLRAELPAQLRRFSGILIDLSFDHFLYKHWADFSEVPRRDFNKAVYRTLQAREDQLSDSSRRMLARLVQHDILDLYGDWSTVTATAERIGERFRRDNPFIGIEQTLSPYRANLERAFLDFYPELQAHCACRISRQDRTGCGYRVV